MSALQASHLNLFEIPYLSRLLASHNIWKYLENIQKIARNYLKKYECPECFEEISKFSTHLAISLQLTNVWTIPPDCIRSYAVCHDNLNPFWILVCLTILEDAPNFIYINTILLHNETNPL